MLVQGERDALVCPATHIQTKSPELHLINGQWGINLPAPPAVGATDALLQLGGLRQRPAPLGALLLQLLRQVPQVAPVLHL